MGKVFFQQDDAAAYDARQMIKLLQRHTPTFVVRDVTDTDSA